MSIQSNKKRYNLLNSLKLIMLVAGLLALSPVNLVYADSHDGFDASCVDTNRANCINDPDKADAQEFKDKATNPAALDCTDNGVDDPSNNCNLVTKYLNPILILMSSLAGLAIVIGLIYGGILYSSSAGDPQKVNKAKDIIRNAVIALLTFFILFALIRFLMPGGMAV